MYFIEKIKDINITLVDKNHNLLELKRVLIDIMIKQNKQRGDIMNREEEIKVIIK